MTKRDLHFFRLDARQAAVIIGLFETVSYLAIIVTYSDIYIYIYIYIW